MINVNLDAARMRAGLDAQSREFRNFARRTIYAAAYQAVDDIKADMSRTFDRPTRWVLNGVYVAPVRSQDSATIAWRPGGGSKSIPAEKILRAQIEGGARRLKRFERMLNLPSNRIAVPARWAELDAHGNISGAIIVKILSDLRLFGEVGYMANRRNRSRGVRRAERYFMIRTGSEHPVLSPGIYRIADHMGGAPLMVIAFVRAGNYRRRFAPAQVVQRSVAANIEKLWGQALTRTLPLRTSRR
jgi:hypothetical protein